MQRVKSHLKLDPKRKVVVGAAKDLERITETEFGITLHCS